MSWITPQVQEILHRPGPARGFAFRVTEAPDGVFIWLSVEELARFPQGRQQDIVAWIIGILNDIRKLKVPCYIQEWKTNQS